MHWFLNWTGWEAVAAIATGVLAGSIFIAIRQINQAKRSTNAQVAIDLFRELRSDETLKKLRDIYDIGGLNYLPPKVIIYVEYVLDRLDLLGALVANGIIDKQLAIEGFSGPAALRCWYSLVHYIRQEQNHRGYYCENYEDFTRYALDYFKDANRQIWLHRRSEEPIELVAALQQDQLCPRSLKEIKKQAKMTIGKP